MKNAAEIGYVRFLHGSGKSGGAAPVQVQGGNPGPSGLSVR
jgi:hypothetical protein